MSAQNQPAEQAQPTAQSSALTSPHSKEKLHRGLKSYNVQFIALGGAIGVGLFLGSNVAIRTAGPVLMVSYLFGA